MRAGLDVTLRLNYLRTVEACASTVRRQWLKERDHLVVERYRRIHLLLGLRIRYGGAVYLLSRGSRFWIPAATGENRRRAAP